MENKINDKTIEEFKQLYNIQDTDIVLRFWGIKLKLEKERNIVMSDEELLDFLNTVMNYDEMQIWLIRKELEGIELTLNDKLRKFFELKTDEGILILYDIEQNYNEVNIDNVRKILSMYN